MTSKTFEPRGDTAFEQFVDAVDHQELTVAHKLLQGIKELNQAEIAILADLFDPEPAFASVHPYQLVARQRKFGRPSERAWDKIEGDFEIRREVLMLRHIMPLKKAQGVVADQHNTSDATVKRRMARAERQAVFKNKKIKK